MRSLSITNNLEILRDRLLREIGRKRSVGQVRAEKDRGVDVSLPSQCTFIKLSTYKNVISRISRLCLSMEMEGIEDSHQRTIWTFSVNAFCLSLK